MLQKFYAAAAGALAGALGVVPPSVTLALAAACALLLADTITGVVVAIYRRDLKSSKMRRLIPKMAQYAGLGLMGLAITVLTGSWAWVLGAIWAICGIEVLSLTENLAKLQKVGANLGPAKPFIERVGKYLADGQPDQDGEARTDETGV